MECFGYGFNKLKKITLDGTLDEFLNLLFSNP
jgi:hypothetical protein